MSKRPTYVLYQLGTYGEESAAAVNEYTQRICRDTPTHVGVLLQSFVMRFPGDEPTLQFDQLKAVFDVQTLAKLAREVGNQAWSNEEEKWAVEAFLKAVGETSQVQSGVRA